VTKAFVDGSKQAKYVKSVLVVQASGAAVHNTIRELVQLRDEEGARTGHLNLEPSTVIRVKRIDVEHGVVNESAFQTAHTASRLVTVFPKASPSAARTSHRVWYQQINWHVGQDSLDQALSQPDAWLRVQSESTSYHCRMKSRIGLQKSRVNDEVAIRRVFSNREVSTTSVQVDRLGSSQNDGVTLCTKGVKRVEQHLTCGDVEWRDHARSSACGRARY
jgi:hypothetical protein